MKFAHTLRNYDKKNLGKDILAGLIIMAVSIPISMGYAQIAGLPAVYGLYGSVFPILIFALFSTSPQFIFGVDAAPAALIGSALAGLNITAGSTEALVAVPMLTFFVALWLLIFSLLKAGKLVNYIGRCRRISGTGRAYCRNSKNDQCSIRYPWRDCPCHFITIEKNYAEIPDGSCAYGSWSGIDSGTSIARLGNSNTGSS